MTKSTGLRTVIKNIVDPIKSGINFVGREIIKPIVTLGGTFDLDDTLSFAEFTAQVKGYDSMSQAQKDAVALQFAEYSAQKGLNEASSNAFVSTTMSKKYSNAGLGTAEASYAQYASNASPTTRDLIAKYVDGRNVSDFSRSNQLFKTTDAFESDPELGKLDTSQPTITI